MIVSLDSVASTQEEAKTLAREGCAHGVVVVAQTQSAGRGRRGRSWLSGPHGLWMSMVLRVDLPMSRAPRLSLCACAVVADVLRTAGAQVFVKWPNDLMVASTTLHPLLGPFRKAGGLLIEAVDVDAGRLRTAIFGLGLNLQAPAQGFGAELAASAGSLADAGFDLDRWPRLELAARLQEGLIDLAAATGDAAFADVCAGLVACSATLGRRVRIEGELPIEGFALGFDPDGALQIKDEAGQLHTVHAGDVVLA